MIVLQLLGLLIPGSILLFTYGYGIRQYNSGRGNEPVPTWLVILILISVFVAGFTLGTIIMS